VVGDAVLLAVEGEGGGERLGEVAGRDRGFPDGGDVEQVARGVEVFHAEAGPPGEDVGGVVGRERGEDRLLVAGGVGEGGDLEADADRLGRHLAHLLVERVPGGLVVGEPEGGLLGGGGAPGAGRGRQGGGEGGRGEAEGEAALDEGAARVAGRACRQHSSDPAIRLFCAHQRTPPAPRVPARGGCTVAAMPIVHRAGKLSTAAGAVNGGWWPAGGGRSRRCGGAGAPWRGAKRTVQHRARG
jgi:hypothetical protein